MKVKSYVYESLTPKQRMIATFAALKRHDNKEVERLKNTCPYKTYYRRDATFIDLMKELLDTSLMIEHEIQTYSLWYLLTGNEEYLQSMTNTQEAWNITLIKLGLDHETMKVVGAPRHPYVASLLENPPDPDIAKFGKMSQAFLEYFLHIK